jgi:cysteine desulfurase
MPSEAEKFRRIYLDHSAATPLDSEVIKAMNECVNDFANPASTHDFGLAVKQKLAQAKKTIAEILNCDENEIVSTSGGTESNNLAVFGLAGALKGKGKHIISSKIEHSSVLEALHKLETDGFEIQLLDVDNQGFVSSEEFEAAIREDTIFASIIYANNEIGVIQDIKKLAQIARQKGVFFHTDACQAAAYLEIDVENLQVDAMTLNAAKIYGPKGVGILFLREETPLEAMIFGGGQQMNLRAGTENLMGLVGFAKALERVTARKEAESERLQKIRDTLIARILNEIPKSVLNGSIQRRLPCNLNISFAGVEAESLLLRLDMMGLAVSSGSACSSDNLEPSHVLQALKPNSEDNFSSIRISLGILNELDQVDYIVSKIAEAVETLRRVSI